jgi:aspartate/methionine/tyrosine aminotransferase
MPAKDAFVKGAKLEPGWLDLGIGEARLVRSALEHTFGLEFFHRSTDDELDYQSSLGNPKLLAELEQLYNAPCVVSSGAKQGIFAALMVAKQRGYQRVGMRDPAWPPLVDAVKTLGMELILCETTDLELYDCFLLVSPNNPDGKAFTLFQLNIIANSLHEAGKFLIHDAAYACAPYISVADESEFCGDIQVHSVSKRFGLSGVRVGWAVAKDSFIAHDLQGAIETMSAGVCGTAQGAIARLLARLRTNPKLAVMFYDEARTSLMTARAIARGFNHSVLKAVEPLEGAFAWCQKGSRYDADKLKVSLIDGAAYGYPSYVRVNLVGDLADVRELERRTWNI